MAGNLGAKCLIGSTGTIGRALLQFNDFTDSLSSSSPMQFLECDLLVIAAPSARKWWANINPDQDWEMCQNLLTRLEHISASSVIHFSTVDVYEDVSDSDEDSPLTSKPGYGLNRARLENEIGSLFTNLTVLRLAGLVGPTISKNPLYDLRHGNETQNLASNSSMQFLPLTRLAQEFNDHHFQSWTGRVLNLSAPPILLGEVALTLGRDLKKSDSPARYDVRSKWLKSLGSDYYFSKEESEDAVWDYFGRG